MRWAVRTLNAIVDAEIKALPPDMQARFLRFAEIIEQAGFAALPREAVKHLDGKLWELRVAGRDGISRDLRNGGWPQSCRCARLHQEDAEDPAS